MAKIPRRYQKIFANAATDIGKFGGAKAGDKTPVTDIAAIQSLSAFEGGFAAATYLGNQGSEVPERNEIDGLFKVATQQLAYTFQEGIPEWDATTRYYLNSIVKASGTIYIAIQGDDINNNTGQAVTNPAWWALYSNTIQTEIKASATDVNNGTSDIKFITPLGLASSFAGRYHSIVRFTSSGSYTPATGIKKIVVLLIGGGGGGGPNLGTENGGGASGAEAQVLFEVSGLTFPISITIGGGGAIGNPGGASSFGSYITCPGGGPGTVWQAGRNTVFPTVSSGTLLYATRGTPGEHSFNTAGIGDGSGAGGKSILGGNGAGGGGGGQTQSAEPNTGSGGGGVSRLNYPGGGVGAGGSGICIVIGYV